MDSQEKLSRHNCICGFKFPEPIGKVVIALSNQLNTENSANPDHSIERLPKIKCNIVNVINRIGRARLTIPETIKLLSGRINDVEKGVALHAAKEMHQYSREEASCHAIICNPEVMDALVRVISNNSDPETVAEAVSSLHYLSHHRSGLVAIFRNDAIPALVAQLTSPNESIVIDALNTLNNLMCLPADPEKAICLAGGMGHLLQLLQSSSVQLLTLTAYALGALARGSLQNQNSIIEMGGLSELLRILRSYAENELLDYTLTVLSMLSPNARNRRAIVRAGGLQTLAVSMITNGGWSHILSKCLWTIHRLSHEIGFATTMSDEDLDQLLNVLVAMLGVNNITLVRYAIHTLFNLTVQGPHYRASFCHTNGVEALVNTIMNTSDDRGDVTDVAVRILCHLTANHELAEEAREAVRLTHYGIRNIVHLLITSKRSSWVRAVVRLIRNLSLSLFNCVQIRRARTIDHLIEILKKSEEDLVSMNHYFSTQDFSFPLTKKLFILVIILCSSRN